MPTRKVQTDPRSNYVRRLHVAHGRKRLNIFAGAGVSQQSGFAGWESFNRELIRRYLMSDIGSTTPAAMVASSNIESTAEELFLTLGRDAAADFVSRGARKRFAPLVANALYQGRRIDDLPLRSIHHQISALANKAHIFTLNFDPLLELALAARFPKKKWSDFRSPLPDGQTLRNKYRVEHLHGWIEPDGKMSPELVLTESDYLELTENSRAVANKFLEGMLTSDSTTLILGMSLADPNFRRVLYFLNKQQRSSRERIYVVMRQQKPALDYYAQIHWASRGLRLLFVETYDEIPGLLRDIQWGEAAPDDLPRWLKAATSWRQNLLPNDAIFSNAWQSIAYSSLSALSYQVGRLFGVPQQEELAFSLFVPFWESRDNARLRMIASSRKNVERKGALLRAQHRVLSIRKGSEQGIAGVCFTTGTNRAVAYGEGRVDINFTSDMLRTWISSEGYRDWRSIIAVPVIDTEHWIPVAVIAMTSNLPTPFWKEFGEKQNLLEPELYAIMRRTAHFCLVDVAS